MFKLCETYTFAAPTKPMIDIIVDTLPEMIMI